MNFLAPIALLLSCAVAVPVVLHLLHHRMGDRIEFPAVRYMLRAERQHSRLLRIRNLLLMLLRALAVLAFAMAAARPVGRFLGGSHAPVALAIVLDNSLSTSAVTLGAPVLARLKDAARLAVDRASSGDHLWLVTADAHVVGGSAAAVRSAIDRVEPIAGAGALRTAVERAAQLVKGSGMPARQLAVLTDGQATSWSGAASLDGVAASVFAAQLAPPRNRAVARVVVEPPHWTPRGTVRVSTSALDSLSFRVALGPRAVARGTAAPGAEIAVRLAPTERGWLGGAVELEPDEMRGDDVRWFAVHVGDAPAVNAAGAAGVFARTAVDALVQEGRVARGGDVHITGAEEARRPAVLFAPVDPVQLGAANRALERADIPWRFGAARTGPTPVRGAGLSNVTATRWYALEQREGDEGAGADTLARVGGEPWAVAGDGYVLVASPLTAAATDLPLGASWVPWLGAAIADRLAGDAGAVVETAPGAMVARPAWARELESPDGTRVPLRDSRVEAPAHPGVYFWLRGSARAGALVVNPEVAESDLTRLPPAELRSRFANGDVTVTADAGRWADLAFAASGRHSLEGAFLALGVLLLLAEAVAARVAPRRAGTTPAGTA